MALNRSDKSRILRRYFPGMTRNSVMSTEPNKAALQPRLHRDVQPEHLTAAPHLAERGLGYGASAWCWPIRQPLAPDPA